jgi:hypothetical protein
MGSFPDLFPWKELLCALLTTYYIYTVATTTDGIRPIGSCAPSHKKYIFARSSRYSNYASFLYYFIL